MPKSVDRPRFSTNTTHSKPRARRVFHHDLAVRVRRQPPHKQIRAAAVLGIQHRNQHHVRVDAIHDEARARVGVAHKFYIGLAQLRVLLERPMRARAVDVVGHAHAVDKVDRERGAAARRAVGVEEELDEHADDVRLVRAVLQRAAPDRGVRRAVAERVAVVKGKGRAALDALGLLDGLENGDYAVVVKGKHNVVKAPVRAGEAVPEKVERKIAPRFLALDLGLHEQNLPVDENGARVAWDFVGDEGAAFVFPDLGPVAVDPHARGIF